MKVFSIYDSKAEAYMAPFFANTIGIALRNFELSATEGSHPFHQFPGDFTLFQIAEFDEQSGVITALEAHYNLGNAIQFTSGRPIGPDESVDDWYSNQAPMVEKLIEEAQTRRQALHQGSNSAGEEQE